MSLVHQPHEAEFVEDDVDLSSMSMDELVALANAEHLLVLDAVQAANEHLSQGIIHGIKAGQALWIMKKRHGASGWDAWVEANIEFGRGAAKNYCRWAYYKDVLMSANEILTVKSVGPYLKDLPQVPGARGPRDPETVAEMKRLGSAGKSHREIAEILGVSKSMVGYHLSPPDRERRKANSRRIHRERREAKLALAEKRKTEAIKKAGGNISAAYGYVRKAAAELDAALGDATSPEVRTALRAALAGVHKAEDEIGKAVRSQ
jgi:predicted transcriptional regulator